MYFPRLSYNLREDIAHNYGTLPIHNMEEYGKMVGATFTPSTIESLQNNQKELLDSAVSFMLLGQKSVDEPALIIKWSDSSFQEWLRSRSEENKELWKAKINTLCPFNVDFSQLPKEELVFLDNSHGSIYDQHWPWIPKTGVWFTKSLLQRYLSSALSYGEPVLIIPESTLDASTINDSPLDITFSTPEVSRSQGSIGDCCGCAARNAYVTGIRKQMLRGAMFKDININPLYAWADSKGGSFSGGQVISTMAYYVNKYGNYPIGNEVGVVTDNWTDKASVRAYDFKSYRESAIVKGHQSNISFIEEDKSSITDACWQVLQAGLSIYLGNSNAIKGSTVNESGYGIGTISGTWYHATCLSAFVYP